MNDQPVIITHQSLFTAFGGRFEAAGDDVAQTLADEKDVSVAEVLAQLDHVRYQLEQEGGPGDVMVAPRDQLTSLYQAFLDEQATEDPSRLTRLPAGGFEAQFDKNDLLRWIARTGIGWIKHKLKLGRRGWISDPGPTEPIRNRCRIAVLSDWGTALYGAPECAKHIQSQGGFDLLFHLGDVYYAGTEKEIAKRFVAPWPNVNGAVTRCLNGNHEMYSGGEAYFAMLPRYGQRASFFAMQNDHWLLVGLDTAYTDNELHGEQVTWLGQLLERSGSRRTMLFSHHHPISLFDEPAQRLVSQLSPMLDAKRVFAWYWGHEHRCVIFDQHDQWRMHGRCVGHSGFPEFRHASLEPERLPDTPTFVHRPRTGLLTPSGRLLDGPNAYIPGHEAEYSPHGYLVLELDGPRITEEYRSPNGDLLEQVELS